MSQLRGEVSLAFSSESNSIFIYYLTGTLALVFLITLLITRSLQRKQVQTQRLFENPCDSGTLTI